MIFVILSGGACLWRRSRRTAIAAQILPL